MIVRVPSVYNAILDQSDLNALKAIVSTYHLLVCFLTKKRVGEMHDDRMVARQYFMISAKINQLTETVLVDVLDALDEVERIQGEPTENVEAIPLEDDLRKIV